MTEVNRNYKYQGHIKGVDSKAMKEAGFKDTWPETPDKENYKYDFKDSDVYKLTAAHKKTSVTVLNFLDKHSRYGTYCEKAKEDLKDAHTFLDLSLGTVNMIYFGLRFMENRGYYKQIRERQNAYLHTLSETIWQVRSIIMSDRQESMKNGRPRIHR